MGVQGAKPPEASGIWTLSSRGKLTEWKYRRFSLNCLKIQELQEVFIEIQDNFQISQNTGGNCHFTGNTGITGLRATPGKDTHFLAKEYCSSQRDCMEPLVREKNPLGWVNLGGSKLATLFYNVLRMYCIDPKTLVFMFNGCISYQHIIGWIVEAQEPPKLNINAMGPVSMQYILN